MSEEGLFSWISIITISIVDKISEYDRVIVIYITSVV